MASEQGHLSLVAWLLETRHSKLNEQDKQRKTVFSSPHPAVVLWAKWYQVVSKSNEFGKSEAFEAIKDYQGRDANDLRFRSLKLLEPISAEKLSQFYPETLKAWWCALSSVLNKYHCDALQRVESLTDSQRAQTSRGLGQKQ